MGALGAPAEVSKVLLVQFIRGAMGLVVEVHIEDMLVLTAIVLKVEWILNIMSVELGILPCIFLALS
jgi:hypothetical protein